MNHVQKWALRSFGIIIFLIILSSLNFEEIVSYLTQMNMYYFLAANLLFLPLLLVKSIRWQSLMNALNIEYLLKDSILIYAAAIFIGYLTPGSLGDFVKVLYLKGDGHPLGNSFASVLLDRLFDVVFIIILGAVGSFFLMGHTKIIFFSLPLIIFGALTLLIKYAYRYFQYKPAIITWLLSLIPDKYRTNASKNIIDFRNGLWAMSAKPLTLATVLTSIGWVIYFIMMYLLALSIHLDIPPLCLVICISISIIITLIPISISGIGTRDATLIILFSYLGYSSESAVALSMTILAMYIVNMLICLLAWLIKPVDLSMARKTI